MEIIIEHSKTKRKIQGPFNICGDYQDLRLIARKILEHLERAEAAGRPLGFGWVKIVTEEQPHITNTEPASWDA